MAEKSRRPLLLGAIADDFTGATDLAALISRTGAKVSMRIGAPPPDEISDADCEVIALKIRTEPVKEVIELVDQALDWLMEQNPQQYYWKYCSTFDSTPEGNIGPVAEYMMRKVDADRTIYVPSFPENGRTVFNGHLFVGDQLLSESPMKDHPLTPMRDSNLVRLLGPQVTAPVGLVSHSNVARGPDQILQTVSQSGAEHIIVDAIHDDDLITIAESASELKLVTGGSALARPLVARVLSGAQGHLATDTDIPIGKEAIVLSGSCSAMTRRQVATFASTNPSFKIDPIDLAHGDEHLDQAIRWVEQRYGSGPMLLYASAEPEEVLKAQEMLGVDLAGKLVEDALAKIAVSAFQTGSRRFVVAGGETSGAVTSALGVRRVVIGPEIAPGVPWVFSDTDGSNFALALKSGNFGTETFFEDALEALQ